MQSSKLPPSTAVIASRLASRTICKRVAPMILVILASAGIARATVAPSAVSSDFASSSSSRVCRSSFDAYGDSNSGSASGGKGGARSDGGLPRPAVDGLSCGRYLWPLRPGCP